MSFTSLPRPTIASASSLPTSSPSTTPDPLFSLTEYSRLITVTDVTSWASANNATLPWYGATSGGQKGITTPVKIGVPIVCIVVGIALVGLAVWLFIRHRRRKTRALATGLAQIMARLPITRDHVECEDNKPKQAHMFELAVKETNRHVPVGGAVVNAEGADGG